MAVTITIKRPEKILYQDFRIFDGLPESDETMHMTMKTIETGEDTFFCITLSALYYICVDLKF